MTSFLAQIRQDLAIAWASRMDGAVMLIFFVIIVTMFPLAIGPDAATLAALAVPIIWIAALLSILAGFDRLFSADSHTGWIDQIALSNLSLAYYAVAKAAAHWLVTAVPLLLTVPVMAILLQMPIAAIAPLIVALIPGTIALTLLGIIGASLSEGARRGGGLMALLVLPLAVPILIFGVLASQSETLASPHLMLLGAVGLVLMAVAPPVAAAALAESDEDANQ